MQEGVGGQVARQLGVGGAAQDVVEDRVMETVVEFGKGLPVTSRPLDQGGDPGVLSHWQARYEPATFQGNGFHNPKNALAGRLVAIDFRRRANELQMEPIMIQIS